jgi:Family of unknown function (DUF6788)
MRRGSVSERFVKCSKKGCACATEPEARHGPYYSLTRAVSGQTQSRLLKAEQVDIAREQIAAGQEFREAVERYWEACEHWADQALLEEERASDTEAPKGGSKRRSRSKSSGKSSAGRRFESCWAHHKTKDLQPRAHLSKIAGVPVSCMQSNVRGPGARTTVSSGTN